MKRLETLIKNKLVALHPHPKVSWKSSSVVGSHLCRAASLLRSYLTYYLDYVADKRVPIFGVLFVLIFALTQPVYAEQNDITIAFNVASEYELDTFQTKALICVRHVENGRVGREYGVLHPQALDRHSDGTQLIQAKWAAGSIKKRLPDESHIESFAARWCPVGAANDPTGLNHNWESNFKQCLARF